MSELIIPILFIVLSIIGKSIEDKKKIEKKRRKRKIKIPSTPDIPKTETIKYDYEEPVPVTFEDEENFLVDDEEDKSDRYYESIFKDVEENYGKSYDIKLEILDEDNQSYKYESKDLEKDLLRGIIFSEILSQPKSIKNRKNH